MGVSSKEAAIYVELRAKELQRIDDSQRAEKLRESLSNKIQIAAETSRTAIIVISLSLISILILSAFWIQGNKYLELKQLKSELAAAKQERSELLSSEDCRGYVDCRRIGITPSFIIDINTKIMRLEERISFVESK